MGFCFAAYKEKDMKLNTKTQFLNVISDENLAKLEGYEAFTFNESEGDKREGDEEQAYHLGATHAFSDSIDMIELQDVTKKTAVDGRLLAVAVVVGATIVFYGPVKRFAVDVKQAYKAKRAEKKAWA